MKGINPGKSHGRGPWVSHERHRLDDSSSANRRIRSCSILFLGEMRLQGMPRLVRTRLGLQMVLDDYDVSPPTLYILGKVSGRLSRFTDEVFLTLTLPCTTGLCTFLVSRSLLRWCQLAGQGLAQ